MTVKTAESPVVKAFSAGFLVPKIAYFFGLPIKFLYSFVPY
ncbi:hypothetical protein B4065_2543 [Caldibacillus thermoamylovorans]|nr:hypothetical protein B4065_2543 [Caldibacillus thermoamylovorans]